MMYACKIQIKRDPQKVRYHREVELPDTLLTLEKLAKLVTPEEEFQFREAESGTTIMDVHGWRLETEDEVSARVAKQELSNKNYEIFHEKYKRK